MKDNIKDRKLQDIAQRAAAVTASKPSVRPTGPMIDPARPGSPAAINYQRDQGLGNGPRGMGSSPIAVNGPRVDMDRDHIEGVRGGQPFKKGGKVSTKKMASGGKTSSASKRADGIATKGKTRGKIV